MPDWSGWLATNGEMPRWLAGWLKLKLNLNNGIVYLKPLFRKMTRLNFVKKSENAGIDAENPLDKESLRSCRNREL